MLGFFFKKNLCDGWDNLFALIVSNTLSLVLGFASFFGILAAWAYSPLAAVLAGILCSGIFMIPVFAWGANARKAADFNTPTFATWFRTMKVVWKTALCFGVLLALFCIVPLYCMYFYLHQTQLGLFALLLAAVVFWMLLVSFISLQWFIPLYFLQEENTFKKCLKKSFIIFFDNPAFSAVMFVYNIGLFVISCMLFFFVPGTSGITLSCTNALRLRLYKYDWLEKMEEKDPGFSQNRDRRAEVPWEELLAEDKEMLGPRKLSSFLFPWK